MEKRYDSDGSERQWQRLHRKKNKDQYRIIRNCHEIIYSDIFLPLPFMRVTLGGYKGDSSTLTLKSNSVENN